MNKMRRLFYVLIAFAMMATLVPSTEVGVSAEEDEVTVVSRQEVTVTHYKADGSEPYSGSWIEPSATVTTYSDGTSEMTLTTIGVSGSYVKAMAISDDQTTTGNFTDATSTTYHDVDEVYPIDFTFPITEGNGVVMEKFSLVYTAPGMKAIFPNGHTIYPFIQIDWGTTSDLVVKDNLETLVDTASAITSADYTESSFAALQAAIANAEAVLSDDNATQNEVNAQITALKAAINNLVEAGEEAAIADGEYEVNVGLYTASAPDTASMAAAVLNEKAKLVVDGDDWYLHLTFQEAKIMGADATLDDFYYYENKAATSSTANAIAGTVESTLTDSNSEEKPEVVSFKIPEKDQTDIYVGLTYMGNGRITNAIVRVDYNNLVEIVNKNILSTLVDTANGYSADNFTAESYAALQVAITNAEAVLADADATQAEVDAQVIALQAAIDGLVAESTNDALKDGVYEAPVALWHASEDQASMAASAVLPTARIVVKDGEATMYIYTQEMQFGTIVASLQELKISGLARSYTNATVETKDADGNPTSFSFVLPHMNEYLDVLVNPQVALMGNQDIAARLKIDYTAMEKVSDDTDLSVAPGTANNNTGNTSNTTTPAATNQSASVAAGDVTNSALLLAMLVMAGMAGMYVTASAKKQ